MKDLDLSVLVAVVCAVAEASEANHYLEHEQRLTRIFHFSQHYSQRPLPTHQLIWPL